MAMILFDQLWISIITRRGRSTLRRIFEGIDTFGQGGKGELLAINEFQWMRQLGIETEPASSGSGKIECRRFFVRCSVSQLLESGSINNERIFAEKLNS